MNGGVFNLPNLGLNTLTLDAINMNGGVVNIPSVDVDLANEKMGNIVGKNSKFDYHAIARWKDDLGKNQAIVVQVSW